MTVQTHSFQAEVAQLLHLVTHSLYSNPDIFLRELISNASDAADKLRFEALNTPALYEDQPTLDVRVSWDTAAKTITIAPIRAAAVSCWCGRRAPSILARWGASRPTKLKGPISRVASAVSDALKTINTVRAAATFTPADCATTALKPSKPSQRLRGRAAAKSSMETANTVPESSGVA